jgi:hypothetical protein
MACRIGLRREPSRHRRATSNASSAVASNFHRGAASKLRRERTPKSWPFGRAFRSSAARVFVRFTDVSAVAVKTLVRSPAQARTRRCGKRSQLARALLKSFSDNASRTERTTSVSLSLQTSDRVMKAFKLIPAALLLVPTLVPALASAQPQPAEETGGFDRAIAPADHAFEVAVDPADPFLGGQRGR